jgi:hypothetical protein
MGVTAGRFESERNACKNTVAYLKNFLFFMKI